MGVFTVFFCGTGSSKFDNLKPAYWNGELISTLASNINQTEFADWIVIDGPGSGNLQADELFTESKYYGLSGSLFGKGWEENVQHAIHIIKGSFEWQREDLTEENYKTLKNAGVPIEDVNVTGSYLWRRYNYGDRKITPQSIQEQIIKIHRKDGIIPDQINLVGWSRGGVSCHMLANAMLADNELKHIKVNIFAVDPVPGVLNFQADKVTLGSNVNEYIAFYARDERSKGFACVIPETDASTRVHIYPMAGRHATLVGNAALDGIEGAKILYQPGNIVRHFAETCLTRWGVSLNKKLDLSIQDIVEFHQAMVDQEEQYRAMQQHSYTVLTESEKDERSVSLGSSEIHFSGIKGAAFTPEQGLSAELTVDEHAYKDIR